MRIGETPTNGSRPTNAGQDVRGVKGVRGTDASGFYERHEKEEDASNKANGSDDKKNKKGDDALPSGAEKLRPDLVECVDGTWCIVHKLLTSNGNASDNASEEEKPSQPKPGVEKTEYGTYRVVRKPHL